MTLKFIKNMLILILFVVGMAFEIHAMLKPEVTPVAMCVGMACVAGVYLLSREVKM